MATTDLIGSSAGCSSGLAPGITGIGMVAGMAAVGMAGRASMDAPASTAGQDLSVADQQSWVVGASRTGQSVEALLTVVAGSTAAVDFMEAGTGRNEL